jgi:hypothetical protein
MRKFSENFMIQCGLGDKFVGTIIGHAGPLGRAYKDEEDNLTTETWYEVCSDKMTWTQDIVRIVEDENAIIALKDENAQIRDVLRALLLAEKARLQMHEPGQIGGPTSEIKRLMDLAQRLEEKKPEKAA